MEMKKHWNWVTNKKSLKWNERQQRVVKENKNSSNKDTGIIPGCTTKDSSIRSISRRLEKYKKTLRKKVTQCLIFEAETPASLSLLLLIHPPPFPPPCLLSLCFCFLSLSLSLASHFFQEACNELSDYDEELVIFHVTDYPFHSCGGPWIQRMTVFCLFVKWTWASTGWKWSSAVQNNTLWSCKGWL